MSENGWGCKLNATGIRFAAYSGQTGIMKKEPPITITLRIAKATKHLLQAAAEKDHSSMANMVTFIRTQCRIG